MLKLSSYISMAIVILFVAFLVFGCSSQSDSLQDEPKTESSETPTQVFNKYTELLNKLNYNSVWNQLSSASQKSLVNSNNIKKLYEANINYFLRSNAQVKQELTYQNIPEEYEYETEYIDEVTSILYLTGADPITLTKEKNEWKINLEIPSICIISDELNCADHVGETDSVGIVVQNKFDNSVTLNKIIFSGNDVKESCEVSMDGSIILDKGRYSPSLISSCNLKETGGKHFIDVLIQFDTKDFADVIELKGFIFG